MLSKMLVILLLLVSTQATVIISPQNGTISVCEGVVQTITCNVTGSLLAWTYNGGPTTTFSTGNTHPQYIAPFNLQLQSHDNGILISVATTTVSVAINGTSIECRNTSGVTGSSIRRQINFNVKYSVPISYLNVDAESSNTLLIYWTGADCIQRYDVLINGTNVNTTNGMSLLYDTEGNIGSYDVLVNSYDYFGEAVGNLTNLYQFQRYDFEVVTIISNNNMLLTIIIKDNYINQQPTPLSCELILTNLTQSIDCLHERLFVFTDTTEGDVYNYTVTIINVIGSAVKTGYIEIPYLPVAVCPSEVQYLPSTIMMNPCSSVIVMSPCSSVMESSTATSVSSSSSNCVLPWTVGVLIGALVVMIVVSLIIVVILFIKKGCFSHNKDSAPQGQREENIYKS